MIYNEFRPATFDDVVGQESNVTVLRKQMAAGKVGNAVLLYGHHGTGKTTIARILAKALNCEHPVNGNPCCQCESCKMIQSGTPDCIEIDAASNNGVEQIREVILGAKYKPIALKYKVYIIDEVHMLSGAAFNALLKTLEEPPEHVYFFLCTTELYKVPKTVQSRCQKFLFRALTVSEIYNRLKYVLADKGISMEDDAVRLIAEAGDGALRDALSILEQCITTGCFDLTQVQALVGILPDKYLFDIVKAYGEHDLHGMLTALQGLAAEEVSNSIIVESMMNIVVDRMAYLKAGKTVLFGKTEDYMNKITGMTADYAACIALLEQLSSGYKDIRTAFVTAVAKAEMLEQPKRIVEEALAGIHVPQNAMTSEAQNVPVVTEQKEADTPEEMPKEPSPAVEEKAPVELPEGMDADHPFADNPFADETDEEADETEAESKETGFKNPFEGFDVDFPF